MSKCGNCDFNYPAEILNPLMLNGEWTEPVCGICALALSNDLHGVNRKKFDGEIAKHYRLEAIKCRKQYGNK